MIIPKQTLLTVLITFVSVFLFFVLLDLSNVRLPIEVRQTESPGYFTVTATGEVDTVPEVAYINAGIETRGNDETSVREQIDEVNNRIVEEMLELGIEKGDIETQSYSITPWVRYSDLEPSQAPYFGNATLRIRIKDQSLVDKVIATATEAGANVIGNATFEIESPENFQREARKMAIENAKEEAKALSSELGIKLGKLVNMTEGSNNSDMPYYAKSDLEAYGGGGPQLQPGTQTVSSTVTLYYEVL